MTKPTRQPPRIEVRLEGPAVPGRISVDLLTPLGKELQTSLRRMLASHRRGGGRFPTGIEQTCALDLTAFAKGSAVLTFEYAGQRDRDTLHGDPGVRVAEEMFAAMESIEQGRAADSTPVPPAVIDGWDMLTKPLGEGVDSMEMTLIDGDERRMTRLTRAFRSNLRGTSVRETVSTEETVEGVLWGCDWKRHSAFLDEADGNRVTLDLSDVLEERVTELRRQMVRVRGSVERRQGRAVRVSVVEVVPAGDVGVDPRFGGFWDNLSLDEIAARQGVRPVTDLDALAIDWPESESVDEFLDMIRELRGR